MEMSWFNMFHCEHRRPIAKSLSEIRCLHIFEALNDEGISLLELRRRLRGDDSVADL